MSRRSVLRGAAGAGAAGLAMTVLPASALAATRTDARHDAAGHDTAADDAAGNNEGVVVHVRDLRRGEMDVYRGTSHVRVTDRDLAARLARASR
jgi:hypothetical protein